MKNIIKIKFCKNFNQTFIHFLGLYTNDIVEADVMVPRKVNKNGEYISHDVLSATNTYDFNNNNDEDDRTLHLNVTISNEDHFLILKQNNKFISPSMIIERHKRDTHVRIKPKSINCHYEGVVYGKLNSRVALSNCNGLVSIFEIFIHNIIITITSMINYNKFKCIYKKYVFFCVLK